MLLEQINKEATGRRVKIVVATVVSGLANAGALTATSEGWRAGSPPSLALFLVFLMSGVIYVAYFHYSVDKISRAVERYVFKTRTRLMDKIRAMDLRGLEQIGTTLTYDRIAGATAEISRSALGLAAAMQAAAMLVFASLYIAYKSMTAFMITAVIYGAGALYEHREMKKAKAMMKKAASAQMALFDTLSDLLKGFKETRLSAARSEDLSKDFWAQADSLRGNTVQTNAVLYRAYIFSSVNLFALLGVIIFVLPQYISEYSQLMSDLSVGVIFMVQPVAVLMGQIPQYVQGDLVAQGLHEFEQQLDQAAGGPPTSPCDPWHGELRELRFDEVRFDYTGVEGQDSFSMGPVSLTVNAGEIVFIVGGNGSGKSTLMKVLSGLYTPSSGSLYVNDVKLSPSNIQAYREMISGVLSDFHLFKKLYGLTRFSAQEMDILLRKMDIAHKISISNGAWSHLDLSTGQRKRLAMVIALLEDRPIYVFDEWAADQDPTFRHYYYEELLPELKRRGKTVIAISHDDRYFRCADRVILMEYGQIRSVSSAGPS